MNRNGKNYIKYTQRSKIQAIGIYSGTNCESENSMNYVGLQV